MINKDVHPHIPNTSGKSQYDTVIGLRNRRSKQYDVEKEMRDKFSRNFYTTIEKQHDPELPAPYFTKDGIYFKRSGKKPLGGGAEGETYYGEYCGQEAVYKFTRIKKMVYKETAEKVMKDQNIRLNEVNKLKNAKGENILPLLGHYR